MVQGGNRINYKQTEDGELVAAYQKSRDEQIFKELYVRYKDVIYTYIKRTLCYSSNDIILDLVDEVFVKVYLHLPKLKEGKYFKNWIYRIAHNLTVDHIKCKKAEVLDNNEKLDQTADKRINIENEYIKNETIGYMLKAIDKFDQESRTIIIMKFFQGLTFDEIADITRIPVRTLKYKLKNALTELGDLLRKEGLI